MHDNSMAIIALNDSLEYFSKQLEKLAKPDTADTRIFHISLWVEKILHCLVAAAERR